MNQHRPYRSVIFLVYRTENQLVLKGKNIEILLRNDKKIMCVKFNVRKVCNFTLINFMYKRKKKQEFKVS